ncbi:Cmx/CmrA family chloramphenicol efflux MFS transporter [Streptomyces otsuchiensis]|uniref:Cmx/CmrA family chloramphenicol efflux MFS transporter n=1 Tax=Streptomyces otsuchiensis TaxID=2681388 RepID=UPI00102F4019|nr:Cmx/CmrA family chloramphenicol efflux MFS transporter [Streptomyces otsuchiensis]
MPLVIYVLGLAVFAQGTSEFMLAGLVPDIAEDLGISIPAAGSLTTAFAVGMIVGAPLMAAVSRRWPRRRALLAFLLTFVATHVVAALTSEFAVLLAARTVGALANAGFLAVALSTAIGVAGPQRTGRATAVLLGGVTVACVAGVPGGAALGQLWGWRSAFWAVALISLPAVAAVAHSVPSGRGETGQRPVAVRAELRALRTPSLARSLGLCALSSGAMFCTFTYLAPLLTGTSGLDASRVPLVLGLFGLGACAGTAVGGRYADRRPGRFPFTVALALGAGWTALALLATEPVAVLVLVTVQGALSFATGTVLMATVLGQAGDAPTLGGGFATAAFNVGAALGPALGGLVIGAGLGYRAPVWVSALLTALACAAAALSSRPSPATDAPDPGPRPDPDPRPHAAGH